MLIVYRLREQYLYNIIYLYILLCYVTLHRITRSMTKQIGIETISIH